MRLTAKKIESILVDIVGEQGLPLIHELLGKDNISEFDLATKLKIDIKIIRKLLYILYNHNLVSFTRKKDKQKGWYIYYWTLLPESVRFNYFKMKRDLLERLKQQLKEEEEELFFVCPSNCVRLNFDQAMDFEFHCPECGELISQEDGKSRTALLKKKIDELGIELKELQEQKHVRRKEVKIRKKNARKKASRKKGATQKAPGERAKKKTKTTAGEKTANKKNQKKSVKKKTSKKTKEIL
ncbi:hypothetical protein J4228_01110 [Candidatus Woesearchaeota archaeon]|nr:hypothetical protein [Candidatus Woesearchaeota archaeon]